MTELCANCKKPCDWVITVRTDEEKYHFCTLKCRHEWEAKKKSSSPKSERSELK